MENNKRPLVVVNQCNFRSFPKTFEQFLLLFLFFLVLLFLSHLELSSGLVENLVKGSFFLGLDLFFEILFSFSFFFLSPD